MKTPRVRYLGQHASILANLALATALLIGGTTAEASAAVYHVTADGVNGSCTNHTDVGSAFSSCADSRAAGCTLAQPCCALQDAFDRATSPGDTVEIHAGDYDAGSSSQRLTTVSYAGRSVVTPAQVKSCSSCTQEQDRRRFRGACQMDGQYGVPGCSEGGTQDRPHIFASTASGSPTTAILIGGNTGANLSFVTIESFEISGFASNSSWDKSDGGFAHGIQFMEENADYAVLSGLYVHDTGESTYCKRGQGVQIGGDNAWNADYGVIENSTFDTFANWVDFEGGGTGSGVPICKMNGWILRNNEVHAQCTEDASGRGFGQLYQACAVVYNNIFNNETTNDRTELYLRESTKTFWFNNFFFGWDTGRVIYYQCAASTGGPYSCLSDPAIEHAFFNNTFVCEDGDCGLIAFPEDYRNPGHIRYLNNIFLNAAGFPVFDCNSSGGSNSIIWGNNLTDPGQTLMSSGCASDFLSVGGNATASSLQDAFLLQGASPTPYYEPSDSSPANGAANPDPLSQGAGNCLLDTQAVFGCNSATSESCQPIDCSLDYLGTSRGTSWDIGAIQNGSAPPSGNVPPPSGVRRGEQ